jgi:TolB protein
MRSLVLRAPRTSIAAGLAGVALLSSLIPARVLATAPGENGLIAFRRFFNLDQTSSALFVINPDGSQETQITFPAADVVDALGNWSPDGRRLAFVRTRFGSDPRCGDDCQIDELYVVDVDGSNLRLIETPSPTVESPAWSPDGRRIAFAMSTGFPDVDVSIWEIRADGSGLRQVTHGTPGAVEDHAVQFSPDGTRLVIERQLASCGFCPAIFTVNATDGGDPTRVSPPGLNGVDHPDWSPDGAWIMFRTESGRGGSAKVFVAHPDGSQLQLILDGTRDGRSFRSSAFSPDGRALTISIVAPGQSDNADIWVGRFDRGERIVRLADITPTGARESSPRWGTRPLLP